MEFSAKLMKTLKESFVAYVWTCALLAIFVCYVPLSNAAELTVCADNGEYTCDYTHIQNAIDHADQNVTIRVFAGRYSETVMIGDYWIIPDNGGPLTINPNPSDITKVVHLIGAHADEYTKGADHRGDESVIVGQVFINTLGTGVTINGFTIDSSSVDSYTDENDRIGKSAIMVASGPSSEIRCNIIKNARRFGIRNGYVNGEAPDTQIVHNRIVDAHDAAILNHVGNDNVKIIENDIEYSKSSSADGIQCLKYENVISANTLIQKNSINGGHIGILNDSGPDSQILNNFIQNANSFAILTRAKATISENTVTTCKDGIRTEYPGTGPSDRVEITGNFISNIHYSGINVCGTHTFVSENKLYTCNNKSINDDVPDDDTPDYDYASIHVEAQGYTASHSIITDNFVSDGGNGIQVWADYVTVSGNTLENFGASSSFPYTKEVNGRLYVNSPIIIGSNFGKPAEDFDPVGLTIDQPKDDVFYSADLNQPPIIENLSDEIHILEKNEAFFLQFRLSDTRQDTLTFTLLSAPDSVAISAVSAYTTIENMSENQYQVTLVEGQTTISLEIVTLAHGTANISCIADDGTNTYKAVTEAKLYTISVISKPVLSDIPNQTIHEGESFTKINLDHYLSDEDTPYSDIAWTFSGFEPLIIEKDENRIITISTPNKDWSETRMIVFTATDPSGFSASDAAIFEVIPENDPPIVSQIPGQTVDEGEAFTKIMLNDFVEDADHSVSQILWSVTNNQNLEIEIANQIASITITDQDWNGTEHICFTAADPEGLTASVVVPFTVTEVNDPPVISNISNQMIDEGDEFETIPLDHYVSDVDNSYTELTWQFSGAVNLIVTIENRSARISIPYTHWNGSETILFMVTDPEGLSDVISVVFDVNPVNDPPAIASIPSQTVNEGNPFTNISLNDYITDVDNETQFVWTTNTTNNLEVNIIDGIAYISVKDPDWFGIENIQFTAKDSGHLTATQIVQFIVNDVNDPPIILQPIEDQTIEEGQLFTIIDLEAKDIDSDTISWFSTGNLELDVLIMNGKASVSTPGPEWNGSETITFIADDNEGMTVSNSATFTVRAFNDPPVLSPIPGQTIAEGGAFTAITLTQFLTDVDNKKSEMTWTIDGQHNLQVTVAEGIAQITITDADWFGTENITFTASDPGGLTTSETVLFKVNSVNDMPELSDIHNQEIAEGHTFKPIQLDDYIKDKETIDSDMLWSYTGNKKLLVTIKNRIASISVPDLDWYGSETIIFSATDSDGGTVSDSVSFIVNAVNDPPVISDIPDQKTNEGEPFTTITLDDWIDDIDNSISELTWTFTGNNELAISITDRTVTIHVPNENWNGEEYITFIATDPEGLSASDGATFTVTEVNDAPVITDIQDQSIKEGETFLTISLNDFVNDVDHLKSEIIWTYFGGGDLEIEIQDQIATIIIPNEDWFGSEMITFTATDPGGLSSCDNATFTVKAVNDPPIISDISIPAINEGGTFESINLDIYVSDKDNNPDEMKWSTNEGSNVKVSIINRMATITVNDIDWYGTETLFFEVSDPEGLTDATSVEINVLSVNDPPVVSEIGNQIIDEGHTFNPIQLNDLVDDIDHEDYEIEWTITGASALQITIVNGVARISIPNIDWYGSETIRFIARDPLGLTSAAQAVFSVTSVNDAPVIHKNIPDQHIDEGYVFQDIVLNNYLMDVDHSYTEITWTSSGAQNLTVTIVNGIASIEIPNIDWYGTDTILFTATDPGGLSTSDAVQLTVVSVNDAPQITDIGNQTISEGGHFQSVPLIDHVTDVDHLLSEIEWSFEGTHNVKITKEDDTAVIYAANENWNGTETIKFIATDPEGLTDSKSVIFKITPVNDQPTVEVTGRTISEGDSLTITSDMIWATDIEDKDESLVIVVQNKPGHGQLFVDGNLVNDQNDEFEQIFILNNQVKYYHDTLNSTEDSFLFIVKDSENLASKETSFIIKINPINDSPVLKEPSVITVTEASAIPITETVLQATDEESGSDNLIYTIQTLPVNGSILKGGVTLTHQGWFTQQDILNAQIVYAHNGDDVYKTDTFSLKLSDNDAENEKVIGPFDLNIHIIPQNDAPTIDHISGITVNEMTSITITTENLVVIDPDTQSHLLTFHFIRYPDYGSLYRENILLSLEDTFTLADIESNVIRYQHNDNEHGSDYFRFYVTDDGNKNTSKESFIIKIINVNDAPEAAPLEKTGSEDTVLTIQLQSSDPDPEPCTCTYTIENYPTYGSICLSGDNVTYTPNVNFNGIDFFTYKAIDNKDAMSEPATVTIHVTPVNDPPEISQISTGITILEGNTLVISNNILSANDVDIEDTLEFQFIQLPSKGHIEMNGAHVTKEQIFTLPDIHANIIQYVHHGHESDSDIFSVRVQDNAGASDTQMITLTIIGVNDPPIADNFDNISIVEDNSIKGYLSYSDPEGLTCLYSLAAHPNKGSVTINASTGAFLYTPNLNENGEDSFTYYVTDPENESSDQALVSILIQPVNDAPVIEDINDIYLQMNTESNPIPYVISDAETPREYLFVKIQSTNPDLIDFINNSVTHTMIIKPYENKVGSARVVITVMDVDGGTTKTDFVVHVATNDTEPPVLTLIRENLITIEKGTFFEDPGAIAMDNGIDISERIETVSDYKDEVGTYQIKYEVVDDAGNKAIPIYRTVLVYEIPKVTVMGNLISESDTLTNVMVSIATRSYTIATFRMTHSDNTFEYEGLEKTGEMYYLTFSCNGYESITKKFSGFPPYDNSNLLDIKMIESESEHLIKLVGTCTHYRTKEPFKNVQIDLLSAPNEIIMITKTTLSDENGQYTLVLDENDCPSTVVVKAFKKGYESQSSDPIALSNLPTGIDFDIPLLTKLNVNMPVSKQAHKLAQESDSVTIIVQAEPPFIHASNEFSIVEPNILSRYNAEEQAYIIQYSPYSSFSMTLQADTTENLNVNDGYQRTMQIHFTEIPETVTYTATEKKGLTVTKGQPVIIKSNDITSKTRLEIPLNEGFDPEKRPDSIDFTIQEYDDYTRVQGKVVSVDIQDDIGNHLGDTQDNPLKKIYIFLGYPSTISREELLDGTFRILHAESAADIFEGKHVPYVPIDQIVPHNTTDDTVNFWVTHLSAFAIQKEIVSEIPPDRELPHPPSNCFIQSIDISEGSIGYFLTLILITCVTGVFTMQKIRNSKPKIVKIIGLILCMTIVFSNVSFAQMQTHKVMLSLMPGGMVFEKNKNIGDGPVFGLGLGYSFTPRIDAEIIAFYGQHNVSYWDENLQAADYEKSASYSYNMNMQYHLTPSKIFVPYLNLGIGSMDFESDAIDSTNAVRMNYGLGAKYFLNENIALRGDIYHIFSLDDPDNQFLCSLGLTLQLGAKPITKEKIKKVISGPDKDGDGITDAKDDCPDTPSGIFVNRVGCPKDSDMDGVYDNLDECPNTPDHAIVDRAGCPKDSDMDGVYDHLDQCPDTPKSLDINPMGCPPDKDKDAVPDYKDSCPNTPANTPVDSHGCPIDHDGDGVLDSQDKCPNTPDNTRVDKNGCPVILDLDNDGIPDSKDQCPNTKPGVPVSHNGCQIIKEQVCIPYAVQVSSYPTRQKAHEVAIKYRKKGDPLFVSMRNQSMFGIFYGVYRTQVEAEKIVVTLKQRKFKNVVLMHLPYAIHVEPNELFIDDATVFKQLIKRGMTAYKIEEHKQVKYFVGAYVNEHAAKTIADQLRADGFKATVEKRCIDRYLTHRKTQPEVRQMETKIQDQDNDGVPDILDQCPDTRMGIHVDIHGCAVIEKEQVHIPYAVQVSSYPTRKQAHAVAMKYRKRGEPLFVSMIQSADPKVFSIFYGVYESTAEADREANNLKMRHFKDVMRLKLPYAILVQPNTVFVDNESVSKHLIKIGFVSYQIKGSDTTKYYVGAYPNPQLAQKEADILIAEGFNARVEKRTITRTSEKARNLPYVLLISAYADQQKAFEVATHFRKKGDPTYNSYRDVPDTDKDHEIYYGYYQSEQDTNKVVETLKKRRFRQIDLQKKPYAICVGIVDQQHDLKKLQAQLSKKGYLGYVIPVFDRPDLLKVYVGAFKSKSEANVCLKKMKADGFLPTIVIRSDRRSDSFGKKPEPALIDSDQDGITDTFDKCPNTPPNTSVTPDGCPPKKPVSTKDREVYPYTIQINAYPDKSKAMNIIRKFRKKGDPMYMSYLKMAQSDNSYGIFYGYYQSFDAVKKVAEHLKSRLFRRVDILKMPYSIQLGVFSEAEDIRALETRLYKKGYASYRIFQRAGEKEIQVLIGAYKTEHGASHFKELLISEGFRSAAIVKRIGAPSAQPVIPLITVLQDNDKDGILDEADQCPGTTPGDIVNQDGCSVAQISEQDFETKPLFTPLFSSEQSAKSEDYYPYTIRVSSYKDREAANQIAIKFRQKGDSMYISYGQTKDGTPVHDVYYGFYRNFEESQMAALALERRHFKNIEMIKMSYAIQIGVFDSYTDLVQKENELMSKGYLTYSVPDRVDNSNIRLLIGAYPTEKAAEKFVEELTANGFSPVIVKR